jgi:uncharacterized protein YjbJ (UPF0337 family)
MAINVQGLQGQWNQLKGEVKKKWGQLTDDDLRWSNGNIDQLIGRIQARTGESREAVEEYFNHLTSQGASALSGAVESVGQAASQATNRLREGYSQVSDAARDQYGQARDMMSEQYGQARDMMVRNPMQWVAAAFGLGFLAGMIAGYASSSMNQSPPPRRFF